MNLRNYFRALCAAFAIVCLCASVPAPPRSLIVDAQSARRPNIVFILIDDLGWRDVGFMGSKFYETPQIDRLAAAGMIFTNAYTNGPNCSPTRASLMSGQYTPRHGVYAVGNPVGNARTRLIPTPNTSKLRPDIVTVAESLKQAGYTTAHIGKWDLGTGPEHSPTAQGFDLNVAGNTLRKQKSHFSPYQNKDIQDGPAGEYLTDRLTGEALKFIEGKKDQPFFLYLAHYAVHTPLEAKAPVIEKYQKKAAGDGQTNATYAAMIESVDESVGRVMKKLDELRLAEQTVVIFYSDNGGTAATATGPLRGAKTMLYEGGIRVPLAVRWPGRVKPGARSDAPVIGVDFYPTLLEIAGAPRPARQPLDGESLLPLLTGGGTLRRAAIYWHFPAYIEVDANRGILWRTTPTGAIRQGDDKLIEFFEDGRLELYNLKADPYEKNNLAATQPEKAQRLRRALDEWRKSVGAPFPLAPNPHYEAGARTEKQ